MSYGINTECSVISCNVSWKYHINAETLVGILSGKIPITGWEPHLETFFNELPHESIKGVMEENMLNTIQLVKIFETLPYVFQGKNFKRFIKHE